jgi:hypothetical protein
MLDDMCFQKWEWLTGKEVGLFRDPLLDNIFLQKTKREWIFKVLFIMYNNVTYTLSYNVPMVTSPVKLLIYKVSANSR